MATAICPLGPSRPVRRVVVVLALCVLAGCAGLPALDDAPPAAGPYSVTVVDVVDGDTVDIRFANGSRDTVRLLGVDTPEVHVANEPSEFEGVPDTAAGRACLRAAGENASAVAKARLLDERAVLTLDGQAGARGTYGRLLAYVSVDGDSFNYRLLAGGHARVYESAFTRRDRFDAAEATARAANRGLWRCRSPGTATPEPRETPLAVVEIHADAAGNDNDNLTDEYLVFENTGTATLALDGWTVTDAAGHRYTVPANVTLEPGATVRLVTGQGTDTDTVLYWGASSAVWNNDGDTITVRDGDAVVLQRSYGD